MGKKMILSHREVEVKVFLEAIAVLIIFISVLTGIYHFGPGITGFAIMDNNYVEDDALNDSNEIIRTMMSLSMILIIPLLVYNFVLKGKLPTGVWGKAEESKKEREKTNIKINGKSRLFAKCHNLLLQTEKALQNNDAFGAEMLYMQTRETYTKLDYIEKKEIYNDLLRLYEQVNKIN